MPKAKAKEELIFPGEKLDKPYITKAYHYTVFQHPYVYFTGNFSDKGIDKDGDGKYDFLRCKAEVLIHFEGDYLFGATLKDSKGNDVIHATNKLKLAKGYQFVDLDFEGKEIRNKNANGPYKIPNFLLYKYIGKPKNIATFFGKNIDSYSTKPYITSEYNAGDFE